MWQIPEMSTLDILLYSRKSRTDDPTKTVEETLARHEQMLDEWVQRNFPGQDPIPEENRYREVVSGETLKSRPEVQRVLQRMESPRVRAILIVEPQRLSRGDLEDIGRLVKLLRYSNTYVFTLQYAYDLRDTRDREDFERELKRGNDFLEYQKRIMGNGKLLSVQNGNFIGKDAPYGYRKVPFKEGKRTCYTLEPVPETAPVVKLIFEMYRDGMGAARIADRLDELHIPSPSGGKWAAVTIPCILRNEHYIGKVFYGRHPQTRTVVDGEVIISRPTAEEYLICDGKHPAIIDRELWDAVQEKRGRIPPNPKAKNFHNPLAGLVYCKRCDRVMVRRTYLHKGTQEERTPPRLSCPNQRRCGLASSKLDDVLAEVVKALREAIADFEIRVEQGEDDSVEIHRQMVERLEKRLHDLKELEVKQWDEKTKGGMPAHVFERLNAQTLHDIEEVQQALCAAQGAVPEPIDLQIKLTTFRAALDTVLDPDAPAREKNDLLKACIERITYDKQMVAPAGQPPKGKEAPMLLDITLRV